MKIKYKFEHNLKTIDNINGFRKTEDIIKEPMLYMADINFAYDNGGKLTKEILNILIRDKHIQNFLDNDISIDTKITQTMIGQFPSIPGNHSDFVPRSEKYAQPDLTKISDTVQHYMCILSDCENHTCTEFVIDKPELEIDYESVVPVWGQVDKQIQAGNYRTKFIKPGEIVRFNQNSLHRASPTQNPGWRFFFRLSTGIKPKNQIRTQVQVYTPAEYGW